MSITLPVEFDFFKDTDFSQGDRVDLSTIDADSTTGGEQAFTLSTTGLTGIAGQGYMFYSSLDNPTIGRFGVNGDGSADYVIEITGASLPSNQV